ADADALGAEELGSEELSAEELGSPELSDWIAPDTSPNVSRPTDPATGDWNRDVVEGDVENDIDSLGFETKDVAAADMIGIPERIGDYVIERMIGSGGMGRVYLAKHQTMQRTVAIKTLPPEQTAQEWAVARFYEEVRAAARLLHPNIATAFDAGHSSGVHFLAMEYINGDTLTAIVAKTGPMAIDEAVSAIRGAARGLAHAHAAGVVHRDVKPSNLMRASDGTIKVVDLGLALFATPQQMLQSRRETNARSAGRLVGTIAFMSPEQLENPDNVDSRSDIYSLGATLYFLLTGRPPYEGAFLDQIRGIRHDPLPELFAVRPDVDLRLEHVFRRMMAKRPQERYASLGEVLADLASYDVAEANTAWISSLGVPSIAGDGSTLRGGSTGSELTKVMGIDLGMFYATAAIAEPAGKVDVLKPAAGGPTQQRLAIADGQPLIFGEAAASRRESQPGSVLHCISLYVGQSKIDHLINGRQCPAEVLLAMQLRKLIDLSWPEKVFPHAVAITVPSSYDQFHRQAIIQAATIAGIRSVRLVDRSLAAVQAWRLDQARHDPPLLTPAPASSIHGERPQVVVTITGHATEVVVARYRGSRVQQISAVSQWHHGTLQWQQKLVDLVAESCLAQHGFDPRANYQTASSLQVACERALPKFLLLETVNVVFHRDNCPIAFAIARNEWLGACEPLAQEVLQMIDMAMDAADLNPKRVSHCLLVGILTRIGVTRKRIEEKFGPDTEFALVERTDIARGAAICVAAELPGRGDIPLPPQTSTTHDFGLLVVDAKNRRRIRPIIPRGTAIPARTNRRIANSASTPQVLTVVESSTWRETSWRSLGSHRFAPDAPDSFLELTFEVDIDGRLAIRRRDPVSGGFVKLPVLPKPTLTPEEVAEWTEWVKDWMPSSKRRAVDS
ncbi:MAG: protein kinase domain-containing protein, partial [Planctomycetaceae bacterium]